MNRAVLVVAICLLFVSLALPIRKELLEHQAATAGGTLTALATDDVVPHSMLPVTPTTPIESSDPVAEHEERLAFHERVRSFFANSDTLTADERQRYAEQLAVEISAYEKKTELSADEAILLKRELIRVAVTDPADQASQISDLQDGYKQASTRLAEATTTPDPNFDIYKVREAEIASAVMQMSEFPDGMTRDEYLRQRLQEERERLMTSAP